MGMDLIKNLRYNNKKRTIKFEIADGNMELLRYYPESSEKNENFKEMEAEVPYYIIFGTYKPAGISKNSINIRYATYKSWELIENFAVNFSRNSDFDFISFKSLSSTGISVRFCQCSQVLSYFSSSVI